MQDSMHHDCELSSLRFYCENILPNHIVGKSQSPGCALVKSKRGKNDLAEALCAYWHHMVDMVTTPEEICFKVHFHHMLPRAHQTAIWCPWWNVTIEPIILVPITEDLCGMQPHQSILCYCEVVLLQFS